MNIYQVRIFNGAKWHTVQTYATRKEAEEFAVANLSKIEWSINRVTLEQANDEESN